MKVISLIWLAVGAATAAAEDCTTKKPPVPTGYCHNDDFFKGFCPPKLRHTASAFCSTFLKQSTTTKFVTHTKTVTKTTSTSIISTEILLSHTTSETTITTTLPATTITSFEHLPTIPVIKRRGVPKGPHDVDVHLYKSYSSACSCLISGHHTVTKTSTVQRTKTLTKTDTVHETHTSTSTSSTSITLTSTAPASTSTLVLPDNCAPPNGPATGYGSGSIVCPQPATAGQQAVFLRIERGGADGTLFEGCISSGPREITTPSGGTHECDGTNAGVNPTAGATTTSALDQASMEVPFSYDGTYEDAFNDFFITSIGGTSQTAVQFWGLLVNYQFTPVSGCEEETSPNDRVQWFFDAFNSIQFLKTSVDYSVIPTGQTFTVTITDGSTGTPVAGASIGGQTTDALGDATLGPFATEGCYIFKATAPDSIISNALYITVTNAFL